MYYRQNGKIIKEDYSATQQPTDIKKHHNNGNNVSHRVKWMIILWILVLLGVGIGLYLITKK